MKDYEIAEKYDIKSLDDFICFLEENNLNYTESFFGTVTVEDHLVDEYVKAYKTRLNYRGQQKAAKEAAAQQELAKKKRAMAQMLISSGFSFDGYKIVKYSGYISGDDAVEIPRSGFLGGNNGQNLTNALVQIRRQALQELKEAAYDLGCNAVVGVDFDYITMDPQTATLTGGTLYEPYIICVTANGNAVVIEKED
jgi:uncharacterized protein YbjQ (UPF0145 family)